MSGEPVASDPGRVGAGANVRRGAGRRIRPQDRDAALREAVAAARSQLRLPDGSAFEPYAEQVQAARAMLDGAVVEMATGEGKTLVAGLVAACWARQGPVHVATANAYLAARDAAWLQLLYRALGLSVGVVTPESAAAARRAAYGRDVIYSTLSELGFDQLRDGLVVRRADRVNTRPPHALIVDEADLLLIDEARTPLLIARPAEESDEEALLRLLPLVNELVGEQHARVAEKLALLRGEETGDWDTTVLAAQVRRGAPEAEEVRRLFAERPRLARRADDAERALKGGDAATLDAGLFYGVDEQARTVVFTDEGQAWLEARLGPLFEQPVRTGGMLLAVQNLLLTATVYRRDRDYLVRDGEVVLIEAATGRAAESRRYLRGLHAAIEVRELGHANEPHDSLAQISVQALVRRYPLLAGMTGTAMPAAAEFQAVYGLPVLRIPRHRPNRRVDLPARLYRTAAEADAAVVALVQEAAISGRPVLIGTLDLARSERISALLDGAGLEHELLNAREPAREAQIVARAGRQGAVTVATAMAGRGTDIRLEDGLDAAMVARAVAWIEERAADGVRVTCDSPGASAALRSELRERETLVVNEAGDLGLAVSATERKAGAADRSEAGISFRFGLGLFVIGVEPGESRRLDDQLRGRAGRQGDEGSTRLVASLDSATVRLHGSPASRTRAVRLLEGRPFLEGREADRLLLDAQRRADRVYAGQRRMLMKLDEVIDAQRKAMLGAYERALDLQAPDAVVAEFVPLVTSDEVGLRPADAAERGEWFAWLVQSYGLAEDEQLRVSLCEADREQAATVLEGALSERWRRAAAESGEAWPGLVRAALLRAAAANWSTHVEEVEALQRMAPNLFAFLPAPVEIPYAKEASAQYERFRAAVRAETLSTLLTLPQPYERVLPRSARPEVSEAALRLLGALE